MPIIPGNLSYLCSVDYGFSLNLIKHKLNSSQMKDETLDNLEDTLAEDDKNVTALSDIEIFTKIWTQPRKVFRYIDSQAYGKYSVQLLMFYGVNSVLGKNSGFSSSYMLNLAIAIVVGAVLGFILSSLFAGLLTWTGRWLEGKGTLSSIARTYAYATIPSTVSLVVSIIKIVVYKTVFEPQGSNLNYDVYTIFFQVVYWLQLALAIWTLVLAIIALSESQKFGIGKAIANLLLATLIILLPIAAIVFFNSGLF